MTTCPECGQQVPSRQKHLPSRSTNGPALGGCMIVVVDENGRTHKEAQEWRRLQEAAKS